MALGRAAARALHGLGCRLGSKDNIDGRLVDGWFTLSTGGDIKTWTPLRSWVVAEPVELPAEVPRSKDQLPRNSHGPIRSSMGDACLGSVDSISGLEHRRCGKLIAYDVSLG
jgi:hypothetical protein